jgi:hypothetical protein
MVRFHQIDAERIQLSPEEEVARDAEEVIWEEEKSAKVMARLRRKRNVLLAESDWTQYNDSPLDDEAKAEWVTYRQELRDLPDTTDDPADPSWPEVPE